MPKSPPETTCARCFDPPVAGRKRCARCLDIAAAKARRRREIRKFVRQSLAAAAAGTIRQHHPAPQE